MNRPARILALCVISSLPAASAAAQESPDAFPSRAIKIVVPFPAGGPSDVLARMIGQKMTEDWGQPVVIENRVGANTVLGAQQVVKAAPDGYTLLIGALGAQVLPAVMAPNFPFDPLRDFIPISMAAEWAPVMLAKKDLPVSSLKEFIGYAKVRPGALNFGSSGYGSVVHLVAEDSPGKGPSQGSR